MIASSVGHWVRGDDWSVFFFYLLFKVDIQNQVIEMSLVTIYINKNLLMT